MSLWRRVLGEKSERPWEGRAALFAALQHYDGDPEFVLPDQPEVSQSEINFLSGALDGIFTHHGAATDEAKRKTLLDGLMSALQRLIATNGDEARAALYNTFVGEGIVTYADAVVERVVSQRKLRRGDVAPHARWLVHNAAHREPLKLGIVLLGISGTDDDIADLKVTARHDEFALYAAVAASNIVDDPTDIWWEMATRVHGWGKIHLVERLGRQAGGRPDLQAWLLRHGCQNDIMDQYLAFTCATAGDLAGALAGGVTRDNVDEQLIDGACRILRALLAGGPAEDIESYPGGLSATTDLLRLLATECDRLTRLQFVQSVRHWIEWPPMAENDTARPTGEGPAGETGSREDPWARREKLGWTAAAREGLAQACDQIIRQPEWPKRVRNAYLGQEKQEQFIAWSVSATVGVDLWEDAFARLNREPLSSTLYSQVMASDDVARVNRVIEFAEQRLPLASIATGPRDYLGFGPEYEAHCCLDYILQEMRRTEVFSDSLVTAGLRSPVTRNRNMAAAAMEAHPATDWGEKSRAALDETAIDECDEKLQARLRELIKKGRDAGPG